MSLRLGSLFSGYGGLEIGIQQVLDSETVWHSEIEEAPSRILAQHWPGVPNLGDVTAVDWATVPPVDVICGGFPCQDVSTAGLRRGLKPGTRSGLWSHFAAAIDALRPPLVVIENVRGLLSAEAHSDLEPDAWDLGGPSRSDGPSLRALGAVLGDLAELGYDAEWLGLRAADAGAPHGRFRVFVVARPARDAEERRRLEGAARRAGTAEGQARGSDRAPQDADVAARREWRSAAPGPAEGGRARPDARGRGRVPAPDADDDRGGRAGTGGSCRVGGVEGGTGVTGDPDRAGTTRDGDPHAPADTERARVERRRGAGDVARPAGEAQGAGDQRQRHGDAPHDRRAAAPDADDAGLGSLRRLEPVERDADGRSRADVAWGDYEPAIRRWESLSGLFAPAPTEAGPSGTRRLSPRFVEWMMGLEPGHVTGAGLSRGEQLTMLGNGVVPQQAALALRTLLS